MTTIRDRWQLYQSVPGWEDAVQALDTALAAAIRNMHLTRAEGVSRAIAARVAYDVVWAVMCGLREFGATDSEPMHYLEDAIEGA